MHLLAEMGRKGMLDLLGVTQADFDRLTSDVPWTGGERNRMSVTLHSLLNASVDSMGMPRFDLPAEWVAAAIAVFVAGINVQSACYFAPPSHQAEEGARGVVGPSVRPERLFDLVVLLYGHQGRNAARELFTKRSGLALDKVAKQGLK